MKRGLLVAIIVIVIVFVGALIILNPNNEENSSASVNANINSESLLPKRESTSSAEHTIEMTSDGFKPSSLTINSGDRVNFLNKDTRKRWPASDVHPTHELYPGSAIDKCGTAEERNIFDSCRGLSMNEKYSFIFDQTGQWRYHDHLSPRNSGLIIVK